MDRERQPDRSRLVNWRAMRPGWKSCGVVGSLATAFGVYVGAAEGIRIAEGDFLKDSGDRIAENGQVEHGIDGAVMDGLAIGSAAGGLLIGTTMVTIGRRLKQENKRTGKDESQES